MQNTRVSQLGHLLQVRTERGRVEQRVVLHDQEAVVVLLQDGHELEDDKATSGRCCGQLHCGAAADVLVA